MLDQTSKRSIFLFIKTIHSARSGSNLECILLMRHPVAENSRCWCPIQLTDFPIVLIEAIRRHRAPDPYQFDSATDASRVFRQVVWSLRRTTLCAVPDRLPRGPAFTAQSGQNRRTLALIFIAQTTLFDGVCLRPPKKFQNRISKGQKTNSNPNILTEVWIFELHLTSLIKTMLSWSFRGEND